MIILQDRDIAVTEPKPVVSVLQEWMATCDVVDRQKEHFFVLLLDTRMKVILVDVVSVGTLNASIVHPREVFIRAIGMAAASFLVAHNHPSNNCEPSDADISVTWRLLKSGNLLGIDLVDHLIFGRDGYYSFKESGKLDEMR